MAGYTKLFASIITSTVWCLSKETRLVWITMLAMKDRFHIVTASVPGLAKHAGVEIKECEEALRVLASPDPYSSSNTEEGRRIKVVDGGWFIINAEKYREKLSKDERREANRIYQQRYRERKKAPTRSKQSPGEAAYVKGVANGFIDPETGEWSGKEAPNQPDLEEVPGVVHDDEGPGGEG